MLGLEMCLDDDEGGESPLMITGAGVSLTVSRLNPTRDGVHGLLLQGST